VNWKSDARIWALIGFGFGAVIASAGSITNPLDALFGGLIQAFLWFFISRFIIKRIQKKANSVKEANPEPLKEKSTIMLFDKPVTSDWLFYVFLLSLGANVYNGLSNVFASGGISTSTAGVISGTIDGSLRIVFAYFPIIPAIYLIRKLIRKLRKSGLDTP